MMLIKIDYCARCRALITAWSLVLLFSGSLYAAPLKAASFHGISQGEDKAHFLKQYPRKLARTYRESAGGEWITFSEPLKGTALHTVTFHLEQGMVVGWALDDRNEVITEYLGEFCSQGIVRGMPKIFTALEDVLRRIPLPDFLNVTDRRRPVLITEYYDAGTARFANTSEIIASEEDAPAAERGLTIIKLSSALNEADSPAPIKGVLAHELAHRVLDHARQGGGSCKKEREANRLIKKWGFTEEYKEASHFFGHKDGDPASCSEE